MRKRDSFRRWKARCNIGRDIPKLAIIEHCLDRFFDFWPRDAWSEMYKPTRKVSRHG